MAFKLVVRSRFTLTGDKFIAHVDAPTEEDIFGGLAALVKEISSVTGLTPLQICSHAYEVVLHGK